MQFTPLGSAYGKLCAARPHKYSSMTSLLLAKNVEVKHGFETQALHCTPSGLSQIADRSRNMWDVRMQSTPPV